ncbi:MAG: M42 family metallopeptidase [Candidatus Humimicrobiaceae bacterium]
MLDIKKILEEMILISAPSGYETKMTDYIFRTIKNIAEEIEVDNIGNIIARIKGRNASSPKIMVSAHVDQLGLIVRRIDENGYIQVERLGGIPERVLQGSAFVILTDNGPIEAVCGVKSHHITLSEEKYAVKSYLDMYLDIGANNKKEALEFGVEIGNPIAYKPSIYYLKNNRISGTAIDNRAACAVMLKLFEMFSKERPESDVYIVGSVSEEFSLRGAAIAARKIKPDISICLDGFIAGDTPDSFGRTDIFLGKGPVLSMYNFHGRGTLNGLIPDKGLATLVKKIAIKNNILLQLGALIGIITESSYTHLEGLGVKCIDLAFPIRYSHSAIETCDISDLESLCSLTFEMIKKIV